MEGVRSQKATCVFNVVSPGLALGGAKTQAVRAAR